jgi:hypothetical protein
MKLYIVLNENIDTKTNRVWEHERLCQICLFDLVFYLMTIRLELSTGWVLRWTGANTISAEKGVARVGWLDTLFWWLLFVARWVDTWVVERLVWLVRWLTLFSEVDCTSWTADGLIFNWQEATSSKMVWTRDCHSTEKKSKQKYRKGKGEESRRKEVKDRKRKLIQWRMSVNVNSEW